MELQTQIQTALDENLMLEVEEPETAGRDGRRPSRASPDSDEPRGLRRAPRSRARGRRRGRGRVGRHAEDGPVRGAEELRPAHDGRVRRPLRGDAARSSAVAARARESRRAHDGDRPSDHRRDQRRRLPDRRPRARSARRSRPTCSSPIEDVEKVLVKLVQQFDPVGHRRALRQRMRAAAARPARAPTRRGSSSRSASRPSTWRSSPSTNTEC